VTSFRFIGHDWKRKRFAGISEAKREPEEALESVQKVFPTMENPLERDYLALKENISN